LLGLGLSRDAVRHRVAVGRLHRLHRGVYALGRPELGRLGAFLAAVFACGPEALLSHESAEALWGIRRDRPASLPRSRYRRKGSDQVSRFTAAAWTLPAAGASR